MMNHTFNKAQKNKLEKSSEFNKEIDLIIQKTDFPNKQKKKSLKKGIYDNDMEYYEKFLKKLEKDKKRRPSQIPQVNKQTMRITRRKKSKTLKITKDEENNIESTLNKFEDNNLNNNSNNDIIKKTYSNKKLIKTLMRKSLKKQNNYLYNAKTEKSDSTIFSKNNNKSLQMIHNIQFTLEQSKKKKSCSSFKKKNLKLNQLKTYELTKNYITFVEKPIQFSSDINHENSLEKMFGKIKRFNRIKTYSYSIDDKKREKISNDYFKNEKIIPIQSDFISNATKLDFSKKNSILKLKDDSKKNSQNNTQKNSEIISIYKLNDNHKKKKCLFCCCFTLNV